MKILALNWNDLKNPYWGGAEVQLEELLRRLVKTYGHEVTLFCSGWKGCLPEETIEGVKIIRRGNRYNFNLIAPRHLRRLAKENNYDILVEDINKIPFYTPYFLNLKTLVLIPHLFAKTIFHEVNFLLASYVYLFEKPMMSVYKGCHFNVVSESTASDVAARGIPEEDISVIYNGTDRDFYSFDPTVKKYDHPSILYLGRIKKYKSIQHLIQALKIVLEKIPEAKLAVVGNGDYLDTLKALAKEIGVEDAVEFTGFVTAEDKLERLRKSHVAVLPSIIEGWGLTIIEANSVGTTVVAANSPGLRDSVNDNETGFLYEYGNVEELAEKLLIMLTDVETRARLEKGGLLWADNFSWDKSAEKFNDLINKLAGEK